MHRPPWFSRPPGGGGGGRHLGQANPYQHQHHTFPSGLVQNLGTYPAFPSFSPFPQNSTFVPSNPNHDPRELLAKAEAAVAKAHQDLVSSGEYASAWKISQSALLALGVNSWGSMGFQMQDVPYLRRLIVTEGKVDAFIHCYVGARRITSLHDLNVAICANEGIEQFELLGLGPLLKHPLIVHYFSVPADITEILKITSEDIILALASFIDKRKRAISADDLLNFIKEKHSVAAKENLGIRIRSLGLHITYIREAKKAENSALYKSSELLKNSLNGKNNNKEEVQPFSVISGKLLLDKKFDSITERVKSFTASLEDLGNSHIRFDSSDDDTSTDEQLRDSPQEKENTQSVSSCPYPSTSEEIARLGLKNRKHQKKSSCEGDLLINEWKMPPKKKKKLKEENTTNPQPLNEFVGRKTCHSVQFLAHLQDKFLLKDTMIEDFASGWREACRKKTLIEVLNMMLGSYSYSSERKRRRIFRSMKEAFSAYPGIGILNVAMACMRSGMMHNSYYDLLDSIGNDEFNQSSTGVVVKKDGTERSQLSKGSLSANDIVEKISSFFCSDDSLHMNKDLPREKMFVLFKKFQDCETWLLEQFSVQEFSSLGYGDFLGFLERNLFLFPCEIQKIFIGGKGQKSLLSASMLENQLQVFLCHARLNVVDREALTEKYVSALLDRQFPTVSFEIVGDEPGNFCSDTIWTKENNGTFSSVVFSTSLLGKYCMGNSLLSHEYQSSKFPGMTPEAVQYDYFPQRSSEDAINCLLKAPMLSDLYLWSHWDHVFGPSMGPLLNWLLSGIDCKELICIATRDGKLIRIDHSATSEEFLEAAIQGSSFQTAVKLLSLIALYGGTNNFPHSLLKHFAKRAVEVMIRNHTEFADVDFNTKGSKICTPFVGQAIVSTDPSTKSPLLSNIDSFTVVEEGVKVQKIECNTFSAVSCFILDCLGHLPLEFQSFSAEILVSGLRAYTKDAYSMILHECKQPFQRFMLHDIGLSLGIIEWIKDYNAFNLLPSSDLITMSSQMLNKSLGCISPESDVALSHGDNASSMVMIYSRSKTISTPVIDQSLENVAQKELDESWEEQVSAKNGQNHGTDFPCVSQDGAIHDRTRLIESIRRDEFGLDPMVECPDDSLLKRQHARLGRALQCLSQELYSQDSHLLLELIQNADDNVYPENVDPSLVFILQMDGIVVLNNEQGFTVENIRALCDIGNSTKKGSSGYIGHKGIGFKSVFRVTDAPEIHSNGFHIKFDITDGQIGFVLPTVIPPCNISVYTRQFSCEISQADTASWRTCIVLPFRTILREDAGIKSIVSLFSDLHPSLLLFLHRLRCIQYKNMLDDTLVVMRRETLEDGIIRVSHGNKKMSWLVVRQKLQASLMRLDVQTTEIAIAFTLQESDDGEYRPYLDQQPVFSFLPLRQYGLKCILQGDFVLPSSREEVDGDNAWNQWLLSEFPSLFVNAEVSFLPCFKNCCGKAVSAFMSFVPLVGEVYGFFSHLPNMILSRLRISNCMLMEGHGMQWVPPCRVLRGWDEQARLLISDTMLEENLALGYLRKDIILSDPLARSLGIKNYGPRILMEIILSISHTDGAIQSLGFDWLSSWLVTLNSLFSMNTAGYLPDVGLELDLIKTLKKIPFIPLSDGSYGSVAEGAIWLPCNSVNVGVESIHNPQIFPCLFKKLRTVNPLLLTAEMSYVHNSEQKTADNLIRMLHKVGVKQLSAHEIIKTHILQILIEESDKNVDASLMVEYISFVVLHFQYGCSACHNEKEHLILELRKRSLILTNHGYRCPMKEPIHFSKKFGNPVNTDRLIDNEDIDWHEVDDMYLKHGSNMMLCPSVIRWREFFQAMGVTDFVQVTQVEKNAMDFVTNVSSTTSDYDKCHTGNIILDWESQELIRLLSKFSSEKYMDKCKYLLEVLDYLWDDCYGTYSTAYVLVSGNDKRPTESSFMKSICSIKWIASSTDTELHLPKDVYFDCEAVRSVLGAFVPYAHPQVRSKLFLKDVGFKTQVTLDDALQILQSWRKSDSPFKARISQIAKFYNFIWDNFSSNERNIRDQLRSTPWIFVPFICALRQKDAIPGLLLFPSEVYWHDPTGCVNQIKERIFQGALVENMIDLACRALDCIYPSLHDFFVNVCGVNDVPSFGNYMEILLQLSSVTLPSQSAYSVFRVLSKLADDFNPGVAKSEVHAFRNFLSNLDNRVLPTIEDKWVSLHSTFGFVCWSDDEELRIQFMHSNGIYFLHFGQLNDEEKNMLSGKVSLLLKAIGITTLSEVVTREAIFYGTEDNQEKLLFVSWILPYAQRYINKLNPGTYSYLKQFKLEKLRQLQVLVVEKLYYRYHLKGQKSTSKQRFECHTLLQENILYTTRSSDTHSLFLELSRFFFDGTENLHLANFLHMITTMVEAGSSEEQLELFIINSQKIPKLPVEESPWSLLSLQPVQADTIPPHSWSHPLSIEENSIKVSKRLISNWPPTNWRNAPGFGTGLNYHFRRPAASHGNSPMESVFSEDILTTEDIPVNENLDDDWIVEDNLTTAFPPDDLGSAKNKPCTMDDCDNVDMQIISVAENKFAADQNDLKGVQSSATRGDKFLSVHASDSIESYKTGRLGEAAAYRYFSEKLNTLDVKWINKESETGLPYDLLIGENEEDRQYIEVKTTKSKNKNWFHITTREWQFAFEKGDAFSIARVVLIGPKHAQITVLKNPVKLLQKNALHLAIFMT